MAGLAVLLHFCARSRWAAVGTAIAGTAALALKPLLNPLLTEDGPFGLRSQTHLNYFVPALAMVLLAVLVATASMPQPSKDGSMTARGKMLVLGALACGFCVLFFAGSNYEETFVWLTRGVPALLLGVLTILIATRGGPREPAPALAPAAASPWPSPSGGEWNGSWVDSFASGEAVLPRAQSADFDALVAAIAEAPGTAAEDLVGHRFGPYEILAPLGAGGMGQVYRTRDHRLLRDVALKLLPKGRNDERRRGRLMREAQAAARLNHPNVAQIYDVSADGPRPYIVMELCEGETLRARLRRGPLPLNELLHVAEQIADALAAAHAHGIVHRDLKPDNVIVGPRGGVKVLDFGLAAVERGSHADMNAVETSPLTIEGAVMGTPGYMSPEQRAGRTVDARADVYAFGVLLHELATGSLPEPGSIVGMNPMFQQVLIPLLKRNPEDRPPNGVAVREMLGAARLGPSPERA
ncbi:MAG: serine/threonine-protein kinase [Myxococcota bacterium]